MSARVSDAIAWVGKVDWELRYFHGQEYSTHRGSSYNSYLVRDERVALIDTVWVPFAEEFVAGLESALPLESIDYVVINHAEPDHAGAFAALMAKIPDKPVYCTRNAVKSLTGQFHGNWNFQVVKTGDTLSLGRKELLFIEAPMLHWPDTMFSYLTGENTLFSTDAFGQHLACETLYNDQVDPCELMQECIKYYANILTPFSPLVTKKIKEFVALDLPLTRICPSHGVIWRDNPLQIVEKYLAWADDYQENQYVLIYDSMWTATRRMAEAVAQGIRAVAPGAAVKIFNASRSDKNDVVTEVFKSKAVLLGSPTINKGVLAAMAALLEELRGLGFKKKKAAAFGSYGWSGESVKLLNHGLQEAGFELVNEGLRLQWAPDADGLKRCVEFGEQLARAVEAS